MARLLPADLELREIDDPAERSVVHSLVEALDDQWIVVPNVRVKTPKHDIEIDVVVAHPGRGVVLVEVKGGPVAVTDGVWTSYGNRLRPPPDEQIIRAKHGLVRRLRTMGIDLTDLFIVDTVGLPHVRNVPPEGLGTALPRERILDGTVLDDPGPAFEAILREHDPVPVERFERFLTALKPTVVLDGGTGRASPAALRLLDEAPTERLDALRALGDHARV
ncbi:MAG: nuclease-related domain-containing protein, partial [Ilumatobacteraceae bacterium]